MSKKIMEKNILDGRALHEILVDHKLFPAGEWRLLREVSQARLNEAAKSINHKLGICGGCGSKVIFLYEVADLMLCGLCISPPVGQGDRLTISSELLLSALKHLEELGYRDITKNIRRWHGSQEHYQPWKVFQGAEHVYFCYSEQDALDLLQKILLATPLNELMQNGPLQGEQETR